MTCVGDLDAAKLTVFRDGEKVENLCRDHASCLCEEIGLHLPDLP